ncbi:hypothetical protein V6N13_127918 [Hibiscus sabdariffa]|uniref:DRBM domain-containing protein n=2 Tax=Hibiscus sabdariffa TaxID=183260 RepID=A0ABR2CE33_9ROSI
MTKGLPEHLLHKNRLQEYAQKSGLDLPVYESSSEGFPHAPRFRATVRVNQTTYTSPQTFPHRKQAEQNVAKVALQTIKQASATMDKNKQLSSSALYQDPKCYKSILNEFAFRLNLPSPKYTTIQQDKLHPVYLSSLTFDGKAYRGRVCGSKKEAEQSVARIAIESLLESDSGILLHIINSKNKAHTDKNTSNGNSNMSEINTQRPVAARPAEQPVNVSVSEFRSLEMLQTIIVGDGKAIWMGPTANADDHNKKRKLQGESWHQKQMRNRWQ